MKSMKKTFARLVAFVSFLSIPAIAFAAEESRNFWDTIGYSIGGVISTMLVGGFGFLIKYLLAFLVALLTTGILIFTTIMDMLLIKVPYIGDILGVQGEIAYLQSLTHITILVAILSIVVWMVLGGLQYIQEVWTAVTKIGKTNPSKNFAKDLFVKLVIVIALFSSPFYFHIIANTVNTVSSGLHLVLLSKLDDSDKIIVASKPLTSLVEMGLLLPSESGGSINPDKNEGKDLTSIYNRTEGKGIDHAGNIQIKGIVDDIVSKAMTQFGRFSALKDAAVESERLDSSVDLLMSPDGENGFSFFDKAQITQEGNLRGFTVYLIFTCMYIVFLYIVFTKMFHLFLGLISRFVNITLGVMFLPLNISLLGSELTAPHGKRALLSFLGDVLVTPLIAVYLGISFLFLGWMVTILSAGTTNIVYLGIIEGDANYKGLLFISIIVMAMLWGILNKLVKLIEYFGANFENIIEAKNLEFMKDNYTNPNDAINGAQGALSLGKTVGSLAGLSALKGKIMNPRAAASDPSNITQGVSGSEGGEISKNLTDIGNSGSKSHNTEMGE